MKKVLSILFIMTVLLSSVTVMAATEGDCSSYLGENSECHWQYIEETETLKISGHGYFTYPDGINKDRNTKPIVKTVEIGEGVEGAQDDALSWFDDLENIVLPESFNTFTAYGEGGIHYVISTSSPFYNNPENWYNNALYIGNIMITAHNREIQSSYELKAGTKSITDGAFIDCEGLQEIVIPKSVKKMGVSSFENCSNLKSITFLGDIDSIPFCAFSGCNNLTSIYINSVSEINKYAFDFCENLHNIYFSGSQEEWNAIVTGYKYLEDDSQIVETMADKNIFEGVNVHFNCPLPVTVKVNGEKIQFDQEPIIKDDRTLVPLRAIFENLGATVEWDGTNQTVSAHKENTNISLTIGENRMYINDNEITLDVPAQIIGERTLVPIRAIAESFDCKVDWDENTQTVIITN